MSCWTYDAHSGQFVETDVAWSDWIQAIAITAFSGLVGFVATGSLVFFFWSVFCSVCLPGIVAAARNDIKRPTPLTAGRAA